MKLSAAIMGHPKRAGFIEDLKKELPGVPVVLDTKNDRWDTGARSLMSYASDATHHLVVQDDAVLCQDFIEGCERVAQSAGDLPVCLYIGQVRPHARTVVPAVAHVRDSGKAWLSMAGPWWGVAVIIPTRYIPKLCEWGATRKHIVNYDKRMARWFYLQKIDCLYTVPSLVDHRSEDENPSLVNGRRGDRRAQYFIGDRSPLDIDWSSPPTTLMTKFRDRRNGRLVRVHVGGVNFVRMTGNAQWEEVA